MSTLTSLKVMKPVIKKMTQVLPLEDLKIAENDRKFLETPNNSRISSYEVKEEQLEDVKFNLEDLHHSIDIKEEDGTEFQNSSNIKQHLATHEKLFSCQLCDYKYSERRRLKIHIEIHSGEKPFSCTICDYKSSRRNNLKQHLTTHTDMDQQVHSEEPADVLQNNFIIKKEEVEDAEFNPEDLHHSIDIKEESESPFLETQLNDQYKAQILQQFESDTDMNKTLTYEEFQNLESSRVLESQENGDGMKLNLKNLHLNQCPICRYEYIHQEDLRMHLITHIVEKFACGICDYKCNTKSVLKIHSRTHTGEKPFACKICDYKCKQKGGLILHLRTHTGEKPFDCKICDYKSKQKAGLKEHLRNHTGEKPFSCKMCDYKCNRKSNLKIHLRTHTGEKPFACKICDYKCTKIVYFNKHIKTHTGY